LKARRYLFQALFLIAYAFSLGAQEQTAVGIADTVYVIREMKFDIEGRTRPYVLITNGEFKEGERIKGKDNLEKYLALKKQLLINQQVLEEVRLEYFTGESEEDGALPVKLLIHVKDSWNFIVLPYPKYDSNEGLSVTLKGRDYNFFGTMSALKLDLGYSQKDGEDTVNFSFESDLPFQAAGLNWIFNFDHFLSYTFNEALYYQNVTGLSLLLPWRDTAFTTGFNQYITFNEENSDGDIDIYGLDKRFHGPYGSTELFLFWEIPTGLEAGSFGEIAYTPGLSERINYPYGTMDEPRKPVTTLSHSLGFGRIDWIGNYRKGLSASLVNSYSWYFDRVDAPLKTGIEGSVIFHWPFSIYFGVSSRLSYRQWWQWSDLRSAYIPYYSAGDLIRGVLDDDIRAHQILTVNLDFPVRVLRFWPSGWLNSTKLHFFDFEMHFSPFTDIALFSGPYSKIKDKDNPLADETQFSLGDMVNTVGFEILVFPAFFRSLKIRGSVGYNVRKIKKDGLPLKWGFFPQWDEIFIGLDHFY
jgi:hypothetical protein